MSKLPGDGWWWMREHASDVWRVVRVYNGILSQINRNDYRISAWIYHNPFCEWVGPINPPGSEVPT